MIQQSVSCVCLSSELTQVQVAGDESLHTISYYY